MQNFFGESIHLMHEGVDIIASEAYCGCQIAHTISFALLFQLVIPAYIRVEMDK